MRRVMAPGAAVVVACACLVSPAAAQSSVEVPRVTSPPDVRELASGSPLDGYARVEGFIQREPRDGQPPTQRTTVWLGYDDEHLYLAFLAHDDDPGAVRARLRGREQIESDDVVSVLLDTFSDQRRAYAFRANPLGIQWDALWTEGSGFDSSFDTLWHSDGRLTPFGYVVTMAIPFRSLRFPRTSEQRWRIVVGRHIPRGQVEEAFWPRVSSTAQSTLAQAATLTGLRDVSPGGHLRVIPYVAARAWRALDLDAPAGPAFAERAADPAAGIDVKAVFRDSVVVDLTANPDFAEVESDEPQVTVNERFEVFFPERRPFFIENADYFDTPLSLVFTRRIADPTAGARATGRLGPWAFGTLATDDRAGSPAAVGIARLSRDIGRQSSAGALVTSRSNADRTNRVFAVDGRATLGPNWSANWQSAHSHTSSGIRGDTTGQAHWAEVDRGGRQLNWNAAYLEVDRDFETDLGFVPRADVRRASQFFAWQWRPEGRWLISWGPEVYAQRLWSRDGTLLDTIVEPSLEWHFPGSTSFEINHHRAEERLRPSDVAALDDVTAFNTSYWDIEYETAAVGWLEVDGRIRWGRDVNFAPVAGRPPAEAPWQQSEVGLNFRPASRLQIDNVLLFTRLGDAGAPVFTNRIIQSRWNWQFTRALSARVIVQHERTAADPRQTTIESRERAFVDVLMTWRRNPWTAIYVGVNTDARDRRLDVVGGEPRVLPASGLRIEGWQVVTKLSVLLQR